MMKIFCPYYTNCPPIILFPVIISTINFSESSIFFSSPGHFVAVDGVINDNQDGGAGAVPGPQKDITGLLLSPTMDYSDWSCLRLVYQITGSGSLEVLQRTEGESFDRPLWNSQAPSDSWVIASMDLQNNTDEYRVRSQSKQ